MEQPLSGKRPTFRPTKSRLNFYNVSLFIGLLMGAVWLALSFQRGQVQAMFQPTPTPTRTSQSYILEAQAYFDAGKLDDPDLANIVAMPRPDAIDTYKKALELDPNNARAWAELARIQAYSSSMLRNDTERLARLKDALLSADNAVQAAPDDSFTHAVRAFVLDWYAYNPLVSKEETQDRLIEANNEAVRAFQIDPNNALALAYYAEILADQQKWVQAEQYAMQAVALDPNSMDTHRVLGYVEETMGNWNTAIQQYKRASELAPNMTFLLISIGQNYRDSRIHNFDLALEYFDRAAKINAALGVQNPIPYIEIAKTYTQQGEFFAAGINAKKALSLDRTNAHTYGQLGIIFMRARNYEGAMPLLKCAVRGCTVEESGEGWKADGIAITNLQSSGTGTSGSTWNVEPLPITSLSIGYYYFEYGNVLAFLSRPTAGANYCADARLALQEAEQAYPNDVVLMENIIEAENICNRLESRPMRPSRQPTATPEPVAEP